MNTLDLARLEVQTAPGVWTDISGPTTTISITRRDGDVGTITAQVADVELDPTESSELRFGRLVRLSAKNGSGWKVLFTGTIATIDVDYHPLNRYSARINLTANDNVAYLANAPEPRGVATIDGLRWLVAGHVPFVINGSSAAGVAQTVVALNPNNSLWNQILTTRDSNLGYAWVDQENRLRVYDVDQLDGGLAPALGPDVYSNLEVDFNSNQIINSVTVNFLRYAPISGTTTEIPYGPYEDATSIDEWDRYSATVTLQGIAEDEALIAAFAADILARNSTGEIRAKTATVPINGEADLQHAYLDLNQVVTVVRTDGTTSQLLRVVGVNHEIAGNKWTVAYTFDLTTGITFPATPPNTGVSVVPEGSVGTPQIQPGAVGTNQISFVARDIGGVTTTVSATSPEGAIVGDLWADEDDGNKLYRWTGEEWVSVQDAAIVVAKERADLALSEAEEAILAAATAQGTLDDWVYSGTTNIDGGEIQTDTVRAGQVAADAITAKHTITGAILQTTAASWRGVKITGAGLLGYDSSGNVVFSLDAITGALSLKGNITSGSNISGATFTGGTYTGGTFTGGTGNFTTMNGTVITGGLYQTATTGERLTIDGTSGNKSRITFHHGLSGSPFIYPGLIEADGYGTIGSAAWQAYVAVCGPDTSDDLANKPRLVMGRDNYNTGNIAGIAANNVWVQAEGPAGVAEISGAQINLTGPTRVQGGLLTTDPIPHAEGFRTTAGSIAHNALTNFGTPNNQVLRGGMTYNTPSGYYTVPVDGVYKVDAAVLLAAIAAGSKTIAITAGGVTRYGYNASGLAQPMSSVISFQTFLTAGSQIQPAVMQTSGAALALNVSSQGFNFVTITRIGS